MTNAPMLSAKEENSTAKRGRLLMVLSALLWGLAGVCVKSIPWNPLSIMAARSMIGFLMMGAFRRSFKIHFTVRNLIGGLTISATGILYMMGIKLTDAATAIVLQYMAPIFILLFAVFFRHRKVGGIEILSVLIVFGGCLLSFADKMEGGHLLGNLLSIASGITMAGQLIVFSDPKTNSQDGVMIANLLSVVICTPFVFFDSGMVQTTPTVIFWVLLLGIFQYGLANITYSIGCHQLPDLEASLILTLEPIFNPIPVAIVCREFMGPLALVGFILVIGGIVLYTLYDGKLGKSAAATR